MAYDQLWPTGISWLFYVVPAVAVYVYSAAALMTIARKTDTPNAWLAWIPIASVYLTARIASVRLIFTVLICLGYFLFLCASIILAAQGIVSAVSAGRTFTEGLTAVTPTSIVALSPVGILGSLFFVIAGILVILFISSYFSSQFGFGVSFGNSFLAHKISLGSILWDLFRSGDVFANIITASLVAYLVMVSVHVFLWWKIAEAMQKPGWAAFLMPVPVLNLIVMGVIAWKDDRPHAPLKAKEAAAGEPGG